MLPCQPFFENEWTRPYHPICSAFTEPQQRLCLASAPVFLCFHQPVCMFGSFLVYGDPEVRIIVCGERQQPPLCSFQRCTHTRQRIRVGRQQPCSRSAHSSAASCCSGWRSGMLMCGQHFAAHPRPHYMRPLTPQTLQGSQRTAGRGNPQPAAVRCGREADGGGCEAVHDPHPL